MLWTFDIETKSDFKTFRMAGAQGNSEYDSTLHVMRDSREVWEWIKQLKEGDVVTTHNGVRFDFKVIRDSFNIDLGLIFRSKGVRHVDTLIGYKIIEPDLPSHSMDALTKKYYPHASEFHKQSLPEGFEDWPDFYDNAPEGDLLKYLIQDLKAQQAMYVQLVNLVGQLPDKMYTDVFNSVFPVENKVAELAQKQVDKRVKFDTALAETTWHEIVDRMGWIASKVLNELPRLPLPESKKRQPPKLQFVKDGSPSANLKRYVDEHGGKLIRFREKWYVDLDDRRLSLPLTEPLVHDYQLTIENQKGIKEWLMQEGWVPTMYNKKKTDKGYENTSPRLTDPQTKEPCPSLVRQGFGKTGTLISEWLMLRARRNVIKSDYGSGWLMKLDEEGTIPSDVDTVGTNTGRMSHRGIANIPRVTTPYGKEFRMFFKARPGKVWVGWDANSLEAFIEAHYVMPYDPEYAKALTEGDKAMGTDVHSMNMKALGLPNRDIAKTFKYAVTYGAKPAKLAEQLGCGLAVAEHQYEKFWKANHGLAEFKRRLTEQWEATGKKYIIGLDGRPIRARSPHSLVNAQFQSGGAIVMKYAMLLAEKRIGEKVRELNEEGHEYEAYGLIRYHDEEQWECSPEIATTVGVEGVRSITDAGKALGLRVTLGAEYTIGRNWAETH